MSRSCIPISYQYQEISVSVMQTNREEDWLTRNEWTPVDYRATEKKIHGYSEKPDPLFGSHKLC
jgi:hypothetical protein